MNGLNDYDMATPINSLKNNNVSSLVRNVENNLETLKNTNVPPSEPMTLQNDPFTYNPNIIPETNQQRQTLPPIPQRQQMQRQPMQRQPINLYQEERVVQPEYQEKKVIEEQSIFKRIMVNLKEYLIVILLFSLLAHKKINRLYFNYVPGLNTMNTPIPSLILRGLTMALILFAIKKFI